MDLILCAMLVFVPPASADNGHQSPSDPSTDRTAGGTIAIHQAGSSSLAFSTTQVQTASLSIDEFGDRVVFVYDDTDATVLTALFSGLGEAVTIRGALVQIGSLAIDRARWDWKAVTKNPFFCPDKETANTWADYLDEVRKAGSSAGAVIEVVANGIPAGLGEPVYGKLDAEIGSALMGINAVKGVEIGSGFANAAMPGESAHDEMRMRDGEVEFMSNHAGGILGGISTGQDIVARFAVKPTSSILIARRGVTEGGEEVEVVTRGRHDPCVGIRAVPVGEAMLACVLADHWLRHKAQCG